MQMSISLYVLRDPWSILIIFQARHIPRMIPSKVTRLNFASIKEKEKLSNLKNLWLAGVLKHPS